MLFMFESTLYIKVYGLKAKKYAEFKRINKEMKERKLKIKCNCAACLRTSDQ